MVCYYFQIIFIFHHPETESFILIYYKIFPYLKSTVVDQYFSKEGGIDMEYVIRGNSAIIKCQIPSFVADFVEVVSWHSDQDESYFPGTSYGLFFQNKKKSIH